MQILFRISQSNDKKGSPKNPDLDFLIELGNPDLDFENRNPDFPIEREEEKGNKRAIPSPPYLPTSQNNDDDNDKRVALVGHLSAFLACVAGV